MPLPKLLKNGLLPEGVHDANMDEVIATFCVGERQLRANALLEFVAHVRDERIFRAVFFDGSFVTAKRSPQDVDVVLEVHDWLSIFEFDAHIAVRRLRETTFAAQWGVSCEEVCHPLLGAAIDSWYVGHFQSMKPATALELGVPIDIRKGIVRVML